MRIHDFFFFFFGRGRGGGGGGGKSSSPFRGELESRARRTTRS
jgi:hypothetical protein